MSWSENAKYMRQKSEITERNYNLSVNPFYEYGWVFSENDKGNACLSLEWILFKFNFSARNFVQLFLTPLK